MNKEIKRRKYEIIVFSDEWSGFPFSCKHLLSHFLPEVPIIWMETIGLRSPKMNVYDIRRGIKKIVGWLSTNQKTQDSIPENLVILNPFQIPYNQVPFVREVNRRMVVRSLKRFERGRLKHKRVLITTWPFIGNIVGSLGEQLSIYYRVDDLTELPGVSKKLIYCLEKELIDKVDIVIASAEKLTKCGVEGKVVKYLPHGVDFHHFRMGKTERKKANGSIQNIPHPIVGFFGILNSWIDFDLLSQVAFDNPAWSFVIIGPSMLPASSLPKVPNIQFLGEISYNELPSHARHFDVAIIPFKINALTISVNPLKLMEYFSLGLPVVSTPLPEVKKFKDHVFIASNPKTFGAAIKKALEGEDEDSKISRQEIANSRSWKKQSAKLKDWLEEALDQKMA